MLAQWTTEIYLFTRGKYFEVQAHFKPVVKEYACVIGPKKPPSIFSYLVKYEHVDIFFLNEDEIDKKNSIIKLNNCLCSKIRNKTKINRILYIRNDYDQETVFRSSHFGLFLHVFCVSCRIRMEPLRVTSWQAFSKTSWNTKAKRYFLFAWLFLFCFVFGVCVFLSKVICCICPGKTSTVSTIEPLWHNRRSTVAHVRNTSSHDTFTYLPYTL